MSYKLTYTRRHYGLRIYNFSNSSKVKSMPNIYTLYIYICQGSNYNGDFDSCPYSNTNKKRSWSNRKNLDFLSKFNQCLLLLSQRVWTDVYCFDCFRYVNMLFQEWIRTDGINLSDKVFVLANLIWKLCSIEAI